MPEAELYIQPGDPVFPLRNTAEAAMRKFEDPALPDLDQDEALALPWVAEEIPASKPRPRNAKITINRMIEIGPTLSCKGCCESSGYHNKECRDKFNAHYGKAGDDAIEEDVPLEAETPFGSYSEGGSEGSGRPPPPPFAPPGEEGELLPEGSAPGGVEEDVIEAPAVPLPPHHTADGEERAAPPPPTPLVETWGGWAVPPPPPPPEESASQQLAEALGRLKTRTDKRRLEERGPLPQMTNRIDLCSSFMAPTPRHRGTACAAAACHDAWGAAIRERKAAGHMKEARKVAHQAQSAYLSFSAASASSSSGHKRNTKGKGKDMMLEFCCEPDSMVGTVGGSLALTVIRLNKEDFDLSRPDVIAHVLNVV